VDSTAKELEEGVFAVGAVDDSFQVFFGLGRKLLGSLIEILDRS